jgi:hypothetical protein
MIHSFQRRLKGAVGVMSLLGTGWFFGIFMSIPAPEFQVGMQYLFILLNSTQVNSFTTFKILDITNQESAITKNSKELLNKTILAFFGCLISIFYNENQCGHIQTFVQYQNIL